MPSTNTFSPIASTPVLNGDTKPFSRPIFNFLNTLAQNQIDTFKRLTPTSTIDTAGKLGDSAFDANFIYIKTTAGWKRVALSVF